MHGFDQVSPICHEIQPNLKNADFTTQALPLDFEETLHILKYGAFEFLALSTMLPY